MRCRPTVCIVPGRPAAAASVQKVMKMRIMVRAAVCIAALVAAGTAVFAQDWPNRVIRVVVPYPPGGATDVMGRLAAEAISQTGQRAFVDNKGGASGAIGAAEVEKAGADGYTFLIATTATHVTNQYLKSKLPYDPEGGFDPVAILSRSPAILVVHPSVPARSVAELIALAKARPGKLNYASSGVGATSHLAAELFKNMADVDLVHIPFRGSGPALTGMLGGQVEVMFDNLQSALPHVTAGKLRLLAVTSASRLPAFPDVPTVAETVKGYEALSFQGLVAPKGTPKPIIDKVNAVIRSDFATPQVKEKLDQLAVEAVPIGPEETGRFLANERLKWGKLIQERGLKDE
jgi:tripartite-type tricarboxylate transporter receptor subunit TctC